MTVENQRNKKRFQGDGVTTVVTFSFRVLSAEDIKVYVYPEDLAFTDIEDYLVDPADYTIALDEDGEGGEVTFDTAPASDEIGLILNSLELTQTADLPTEGNFNEESVETALDRAVLQNIQQQERVQRGLALRVEDPLVDDDFEGFYIEAVEPADRASRIMQFTEDGDGVEAGILITDLDTLAGITAEIATVAGIASEIVSVVGVSAEIVTVAGIAGNVTTVAGIAAAVTTVAGNTANINTVAGIDGEITTVAGVAAAVSTVAAISGNVTTVAGIAANVTTVAGIAANVTTVAGISAAVVTVAGISADVSTVAANITDVQNAEENANIAKAAAGFTYTYSTTTAADDPGAGFFRLNNATIASATEMYISETTGMAQAIAAEIATWDDSTSTIRGKLRIFKQSNPAVFAIFDVTGTITDNGDWDTLTVAYAAGSGAWADNDVMTVQFIRNGDKGDIGPSGSIDFPALTAETVIAANDYMVINDVSEGATAVNKILISDFMKIINLLTTTALAAGDFVPFYDISGTISGKVTVQNFFDFINSLTAETAPATGDKVPLIDVSASNNCDSITLENFFKVIASLTSVTAPAIDDILSIYDTSASIAGRMRFDDFLKVINSLTEDTAPDVAADFLLAYDTSASGVKKVKPSNLIKVLHIQDQKASGTDGGTATAGSWQTRTLNTEVTDGIGSTLSSNQFTLPAGTYHVRASAPAFSCSQHQIRLQNITDAATTLLGTSECTNPGAGDGVSRSEIDGTFTIAAGKTFELQHRVAATKASNGYGIATAWGTEIYANIFIERIG